MQSRDLESRDLYTPNIAAAASLVAIGGKLREPVPVTVTVEGDREQVLFWFQQGDIECGGMRNPAGFWLEALTCSWADFGAKLGLNLEHPIAFLKASAENRSVLVAGVKRARGKPFRVVRKDNRIIVVGADTSEESMRRLLAHG